MPPKTLSTIAPLNGTMAKNPPKLVITFGEDPENQALLKRIHKLVQTRSGTIKAQSYVLKQVLKEVVDREGITND